MDKELTIVVSNRDRLDFNNPASQWWLKSLQWQDYKDFEIIIVDAYSRNHKELVEYLKEFSIKIIQPDKDKIGEAFHLSFLKNFGIREAKTKYVACTDVDMLYGKRFFSEVGERLKENTMIESRTMYWKQPTADRIYSGELDPYMDLDSCKNGRIKKRTTAGGLQCLHINDWNKIRGYNESIIGWGSDDVELLARAKLAKINISWLGESVEDIMLFHQPHIKLDAKKDLEYQEKNKAILHSCNGFLVNSNGWGGKND